MQGTPKCSMVHQATLGRNPLLRANLVFYMDKNIILCLRGPFKSVIASMEGLTGKVKSGIHLSAKHTGSQNANKGHSITWHSFLFHYN